MYRTHISIDRPPLGDLYNYSDLTATDVRRRVTGIFKLTENNLLNTNLLIGKFWMLDVVPYGGYYSYSFLIVTEVTCSSTVTGA